MIKTRTSILAIAVLLPLCIGCTTTDQFASPVDGDLSVQTTESPNGNMMAVVQASDPDDVVLLLVWSSITGDLAVRMQGAQEHVIERAEFAFELDQTELEALARKLGESVRDTGIPERRARLEATLP